MSGQQPPRQRRPFRDDESSHGSASHSPREIVPGSTGSDSEHTNAVGAGYERQVRSGCVSIASRTAAHLVCYPVGISLKPNAIHGDHPFRLDHLERVVHNSFGPPILQDQPSRPGRVRVDPAHYLVLSLGAKTDVCRHVVSTRFTLASSPRTTSSASTTSTSTHHSPSSSSALSAGSSDSMANSISQTLATAIPSTKYPSSACARSPHF